MREGRYRDEPPEADTAGMTAQERRDTAYRRRRAFLRSIGLPGARMTQGRADRPSNSPERRREYNRRWYIRKVAAECGISEAAAEALTPRRPGNGQRSRVVRDAEGRFARITTTSRVVPGER